MNSNDVIKFYDEYTKKQTNKGINLRHLSIVNYLLKSGLKNDSTVLEIGCGIGTVTSLIGKVVSKGKIIALDISPSSIEIAKKTVKNKNIEFIAVDVNNLQTNLSFDFVVLPDVLEHIPVEYHNKIFESISRLLNDKGKIVIHIPSPSFLTAQAKFEPKELQIIDQPLYTNDIFEAIKNTNLEIYELLTYNLFTRHENYRFITLSKKQVLYQIKYKTKLTIIINKFLSRVQFFVRLYLS